MTDYCLRCLWSTEDVCVFSCHLQLENTRVVEVSCKEAINEAIEDCLVPNCKSFQCFCGVKVLDLLLSFSYKVSCKLDG